VTIYVDFDADPTTGPLTDVNGNKYDVALSLKELERAKIYDTGDRDQTGMLVYTLTPGVKLAAAWGQDPLTASAAAPGLDVGTGIPPLPLFSAGKNGTLSSDNDGDGFIGPGDVILYTIPIVNISRAPVPDILLTDTIPPDTTYVPNSTFFTNAANVTTQIPDDGVGTPFPLDDGGVILDPITALPVGGSYQVTFKVTIKPFDDLTPGTSEIVNNCTATAVGVTVKCKDTTPLNGCIGDFVWYDLDGDGIQDGGPETGISGVTLNLYRDVNGDGILDGGDTLITSQNTNGSGNYKFLGLLADKYIVDVTSGVPPGYGLTTGNDPMAITLAGGECNLNADFGYVLLPTVTPTPTLSATPTPTATTTPTATFTVVATTTAIPTATVTATTTPVATATATPTATMTATITPVVTATATFTPAVTTTATLTPVETGTPSSTPTPASASSTPTASATPPSPCGNGQLDPGETCDPPGTLMPPNDNPCRQDCTYCGDTVVQPTDNESCDDGNSVSGCNPNRPQTPLDPCLNNCQETICEDPSRIQFYQDRDDVLQLHARLIVTDEVDFTTSDFRIKLSRRACSHDASLPCGTDHDCDAVSPGSVCTESSEGSLVFDRSLVGQTIDGNGKRWRYRNPSAKTTGGIYQLKITSKTAKKSCAAGTKDGARCATATDCPQGACVGYYAIKLKAYGEAGRAVSDMETQIYGGGHGWAVRGVWQQVASKGWRLYKKSELLDPWF
ncbi:MAG TPA: SdrD B-like domain-containing protein, partial [Gaiellaceae bacterium]|nr:SdrD B-like domain-containing protein [Gaiellaceae bacterium]